MELDGSSVSVEQVSVLGLVNFGHFTSMRVEGRAGVRGLSLHLDRLTQDCRSVFDVDLDPEYVRGLVRHALQDSDDVVVVRVTVFDPTLELGKPGADAEPHVLVTKRKAPQTPLAPLSLQSAAYARDLPKVKHVGLFGALYQRRDAQRNGYDDVLFTTAEGTVTEAATSNVAFIDAAGQLVWPQADVLPGTTMRLVNQARDEDVVAQPITLAQVPEFIGAVVTNAAVGVRVVGRIDDTRWPIEHEIVDIIRKQYEAIPPERI
ncbi:aminotransferase class IV [Nocardia terpenica]|uniref:Aminotransferase n=1 Tax=Nocardia terpenica TaxID=455432 RepID=A0A291RQ14_9NOCA|nr:aminotransferase class IV [Nocardia terpenica]ATL69711.1 aminotransferase [Nocardia terpenica]